MKKRLLMILAVSVLMIGCGNTDTTDNAQGTEAQQTQEETEPQTEEATIHEHIYTESITTEATCEADGVKTFTCECGDTYTEAITASGHSYGEYVYNNDATTSADGTETATCSVCGGKDTRTKAGTKIVETKKWYDGYAFDVWLDMGEYYMYLSYSKDAAIAAPQIDHEARLSTLRSRYPDADFYEMGCDYGGGVYGSVMSISRGETGTSSWYRPHFPWE